jgi:kynurenine formamidase
MEPGSANKIVDLTMTLEDGQRGVSFETKFTVEDDGWNARTLHLYSHAGTHLDAPLHFGCADTTVDEIPLDACMGPAYVVDITALPPRALVDVDHLGDVAAKFRPGDSLLLHSGWSRHAADPDYYRNAFPRISEPLATWCAASGVKMLGVEPPSVADVNDLAEVTRVHQILLGADIVIVEGLTNLASVTSRRVWFAAIPLKIGGGDGTPCRAFAVDGGENLINLPVYREG